MELQIWKYGACLVVFDNTQQFACLSSSSSKDFVRLFGVSTPPPIPPLLPSSKQSQPQDNQIENDQQMTNEAKETEKEEEKEKEKEHHGPQLQQIIVTKEETLLEGLLLKKEYHLPPHQRFLYLTLANRIFWETSHNLSLLSPPSYSDLPNPLFQTLPLLNMNAVGPLPLQEYKKGMNKNGEFWIDSNSRKVVEEMVKNESIINNNEGGMDVAVVVDGNSIDQCNLEFSLDNMSL